MQVIPMMWLHSLFLSTSGEPSLLEELWEYFEGKYFSVDVGRYEYISIGSGSLVTLQKIVLGIAVGIIIAAAMTCYDKTARSRPVSRAPISLERSSAVWKRMPMNSKSPRPGKHI